MTNDITTVALTQYGVTEIRGIKHNPKIVNYSKESGFNGVIDDETSWCSVFMNWCALKAGMERSKALTARSWLKIGEKVTTPKTGDIVVFWRESPSSWKGHVGIFINYTENGKYIRCLGGNQSNKVCIAKYPVKELLGFRRLKKAS